MPTAEKGGGGTQTSDASNYPYNYLQRFDLIFANGQQMKEFDNATKACCVATLALARPLKICIKCTRGQVQSYDKSL